MTVLDVTEAKANKQMKPHHLLSAQLSKASFHSKLGDAILPAASIASNDTHIAIIPEKDLNIFLWL